MQHRNFDGFNFVLLKKRYLLKNPISKIFVPFFESQNFENFARFTKNVLKIKVF